MFTVSLPVFAADETAQPVAVTTAAEEETSENELKSDKAMSAALVVGIAAASGAIAMGWAISKAVEGIARQPEAQSKIQTTMMLGLVFVETAIIYALVIAILIIFVL
ncbi:MAG: ATP synthase F0 subunit C [Oscillospiraceae bacterium]|nr:ATP synthase F0 subunit C [Oscillospiraceae bacterium]